MISLKFFQYAIIGGFLINASAALSMKVWDHHQELFNEYDNFVPSATKNKYFEKFNDCILDREWECRNIRGENDSVRFQGNPPLIFDFLKDSYSAFDQKLVMDLAGADGRVAELALFTGAKVILVDRNPSEIKEANERIKYKRNLPKEFIERYDSYSTDVLHMDKELTQFLGKVDSIHMSNLLHFFDGEQTENLLNNLGLFLKKGGRVYGEVDSIYASSSNLKMFTELKDSQQLHPGIFSIGPRIHNYYSVDSLQNLLEKFGFSPISIYYSDSFCHKLRVGKPEKSVKVVFSFEMK